jgi:hypothetical protein
MPDQTARYAAFGALMNDLKAAVKQAAVGE